MGIYYELRECKCVNGVIEDFSSSDQITLFFGHSLEITMVVFASNLMTMSYGLDSPGGMVIFVWYSP